MAITMGRRAFEAGSKYILDEFTVSYTYLSMSCVFRDMGLGNCADWALKTSEDNRSRALAFLHHLEKRGVRIKLASIPVGRQDWRAPLHIFEEMYRLEQKLTDLLSTVLESAIADKDYISQQFVMNFFEVHLQSEYRVMSLLNRLRKMQASESDIFKFDEEIKALC